MYVRRKIFFVDHLIFAFHLHSAMFLIISLTGLLGLIINLNTDWLLLYIPFYYYIAIKTVYGQGWMKTLAKGSIAGFLYLFFGVFVLAVVATVMFLFL